MQRTLSDLNNVWEVKPLKMAGENEARKILDNVAKQVEPIMHKHKWKVSVLSEFCPSDPCLMGLNIGGGAEVKLRLRQPQREWDFLPYEQILGTMLHELCHNEHGPHNADFYKLLDEIRLECEELMTKGITGTGKGFDLPGRRLGGFSQPPPLLRQTMLSAAERRAQRGSLMPAGSRQIGGDSSIKAALSPVQAASMAAERRFRDELWCGSKPVYNGRSVADSGSSSMVSVRQQISSLPGSSTLISSQGSRANHEEKGTRDTWLCSACTLINTPLAQACEVCQTTKEVGPRFRSWSCKFCTLINPTELERCSACDEWRYSHGPPCN